MKDRAEARVLEGTQAAARAETEGIAAAVQSPKPKRDARRASHDVEVPVVSGRVTDEGAGRAVVAVAAMAVVVARAEEASVTDQSSRHGNNTLWCRRSGRRRRRR